MVTSIGGQDTDYRLTSDCLVRFRDMIYVLDYNEIKKLMLREFTLGHTRVT